MIMNPGDIQTDGRRKMKWFSFAEVELIILPELPHISVYSLQSVQRELYNLQRGNNFYLGASAISSKLFSDTILEWISSPWFVDLCQYTHYQYCQSVELFRIVAFWLFPRGCERVPSRSFVLLQCCSAACREKPASKNGTSMCIVIITIITTTGD